MVTSAASLIQGVVQYYADDYKGCVQLAVSRLSRVRQASWFSTMFSSPVSFLYTGITRWHIANRPLFVFVK